MESLNRTWFIDIDGTIVKHRTNDELDRVIEEMGEESHNFEEILPESLKFVKNLPEQDTVVLTTARETRHKDHTERLLKSMSFKYDLVIFNLRSGARILINDIKPPGVAGNEDPLQTAFAINVNRDEGIRIVEKSE